MGGPYFFVRNEQVNQPKRNSPIGTKPEPKRNSPTGKKLRQG